MSSFPFDRPSSKSMPDEKSNITGSNCGCSCKGDVKQESILLSLAEPPTQLAVPAATLSSCCVPTTDIESDKTVLNESEPVAAAESDHPEIVGARTRPAVWHELGFPIFAVAAILLSLLILAPHQALATLLFAGSALTSILPFFAASITLAAAVKAAGAESLISRIFVGREKRMIFMAALLGALSPFCSCGVIPLVAGLLAAGVPIAPVMAFWISSPLMDPNMFVLTAGGIGVSFALAKMIAAIGMGLFAGFATAAAVRLGWLQAPLRTITLQGCCSGAPSTPLGPTWRFWNEPSRARTFVLESARNAWFLGRWLTFAFVLESLMLAYIPSDLIARWLGGDGIASVLVALGVGIPAYLNGYAAIPLVAGLINLGMHPAAGLAFMLGGGVTSVPAAIAVWAIATPRLFALYLVLAAIGSLSAAYVYMAYLALP